MSSIRKNFLVELIKLDLRSRLSNTDKQDVASALNISLPEAEAVAIGLEEDGCIKTVGVGGNIVPTDKGRRLAADPNWESE
jgi:Mn-dependent DtxR family transcriptional regulator